MPASLIESLIDESGGGHGFCRTSCRTFGNEGEEVFQMPQS